MGFSRTIAGLVVAVAGLGGITLSQNTVVEGLGIAAQVAGLGLAYYERVRRGDISPLGVRHQPRQRRRGP